MNGPRLRRLPSPTEADAYWWQVDVRLLLTDNELTSFIEWLDANDTGPLPGELADLRNEANGATC